ncbi:MAG: bacillithiol biosynthesis BshC [Bacteroidetes bacterium]|nr:bacillithiol biosynthesis BshC [Bacteroidota bacterium]
MESHFPQRGGEFQNLLSENTFTVTTGHQLNLFPGLSMYCLS